MSDYSLIGHLLYSRIVTINVILQNKKTGKKIRLFKNGQKWTQFPQLNIYNFQSNW